MNIVGLNNSNKLTSADVYDLNKNQTQQQFNESITDAVNKKASWNTALYSSVSVQNDVPSLRYFQIDVAINTPTGIFSDYDLMVVEVTSSGLTLTGRNKTTGEWNIIWIK